MKTHEYQAREILKGYGIPFPPAQVAETPEEAETIARDLGGSVVVKAQALVGGRGKAGGVKRAVTPDEARQAAVTILGDAPQGPPGAQGPGGSDGRPSSASTTWGPCSTAPPRR